MAKIHINFHITNIFLHQFAILWVICVGVWDYLPRRNHMGLRWFHTSGGVAIAFVSRGFW